ncbi:hypothetical protein BH18ACI5_BH18ACI5_24400 [soil metagenome]
MRSQSITPLRVVSQNNRRVNLARPVIQAVMALPAG